MHQGGKSAPDTFISKWLIEKKNISAELNNIKKAYAQLGIMIVIIQ